MKFARYIQGLEHDCPSEWRGKFIRYKELKKLLKPISSEPLHAERTGTGPDTNFPPSAQDAEDVFFAALSSQMKIADIQFQKQALAIISAFERSQFQNSAFCLFGLFRRNREQQSARLSQQAYWCRKFAKANAVALRKILKKHDKVARNLHGRQFLQESWQPRGNNGVGIFLHSPLLDELKAVQDVLLEQAPRCLDLHEETRQDRTSHDKELEVLGGSPAVAGRKEGAWAGDGAPAGSPCDDSGCRLCGDGGRGTAAPSDAIQLARPSSGSSATGPRPPSAPPSLSGQGHRDQSLAPSPAAQAAASRRGAGRLAHVRTVSAAPSFVTSSSLRVQRDEGLAAICESPSFLLDSSDVEWEGLSPLPHQRSTLSAILSEQGGSAGGQTVEGTPSCPSAPGSPGNPSAGGTSAALPQPLTGNPSSSAASGQLRSGFQDLDLVCPICLDSMYKPVGLACGHKFCKRCALEAAGFGQSLGTFASIISHVPRRTVCPECRQPDVYRCAVSLREVGKLIARRNPKAWAERRAEDKALERVAAERVLERHMNAYRPVMHASSVYELLL